MDKENMGGGQEEAISVAGQDHYNQNTIKTIPQDSSATTVSPVHVAVFNTPELVENIFLAPPASDIPLAAISTWYDLITNSPQIRQVLHRTFFDCLLEFKNLREDQSRFMYLDRYSYLIIIRRLGTLEVISFLDNSSRPQFLTILDAAKGPVRLGVRGFPGAKSIAIFNSSVKTQR
jgi:hypothetical protein